MEHKCHEEGRKDLKVQNESKGNNGTGGKKIPPGAWMSVSCECCVLSGRGLCDGLITRPEVVCGVSQMCVTMKPRRNEEAQPI
jgi:hypothetical protein